MLKIINRYIASLQNKLVNVTIIMIQRTAPWDGQQPKTFYMVVYFVCNYWAAVLYGRSPVLIMLTALPMVSRLRKIISFTNGRN